MKYYTFWAIKPFVGGIPILVSISVSCAREAIHNRIGSITQNCIALISHSRWPRGAREAISLMHWRYPAAILEEKRWRKKSKRTSVRATHGVGQWTTSRWPLGEGALLKWRHAHKVYCCSALPSSNTWDHDSVLRISFLESVFRRKKFPIAKSYAQW